MAFDTFGGIECFLAIMACTAGFAGFPAQGLTIMARPFDSTYYVPPHPFQVFLEAESAEVAGSEAFALAFAAAEPSPEGHVLAAEPEAVFVVAAFVAEPRASALAFAASALSPEGLVLSVEPAVVFVVEPQASVDIAVAFVVLVPVSVVVVEVDNSGHPKFLAFPNVDHFASSSSSVEVVG